MSELEKNNKNIEEDVNTEEEVNLEDYCIHNCDKCQYFHIVESFCELFDDEDYLNYL